mmetsp:Transcript_7596/g.11047  ORF Transcript_7596/g.11047 Transcript_7596/m.11047 type:complete len:311 (-) Transcript_7596:91-1023(-)
MIEKSVRVNKDKMLILSQRKLLLLVQVNHHLPRLCLLPLCLQLLQLYHQHLPQHSLLLVRRPHLLNLQGPLLLHLLTQLPDVPLALLPALQNHPHLLLFHQLFHFRQLQNQLLDFQQHHLPRHRHQLFRQHLLRLHQVHQSVRLFRYHLCLLRIRRRHLQHQLESLQPPLHLDLRLLRLHQLHPQSPLLDLLLLLRWQHHLGQLYHKLHPLLQLPLQHPHLRHQQFHPSRLHQQSLQIRQQTFLLTPMHHRCQMLLPPHSFHQKFLLFPSFLRRHLFHLLLHRFPRCPPSLLSLLHRPPISLEICIIPLC